VNHEAALIINIFNQSLLNQKLEIISNIFNKRTLMERFECIDNGEAEKLQRKLLPILIRRERIRRRFNRSQALVLTDRSYNLGKMS
jgi:hypothetical protein